jgi:hypothetical protein
LECCFCSWKLHLVQTEMERDAAVSHGTSSFLLERLMKSADKYQTVFCKTCGTFAVNDENTGYYKTCRICGDDKNFGRCSIPYPYKLLMHLLGAIGLHLRPELITLDEYIGKVLEEQVQEFDILEDIKCQLEDTDIALPDEEAEFAREDQETTYEDIYGD